MSLEKQRVKVLLTKPTLDDHDRGLRLVAVGLRDAGMEVVFTRFKLPEEIVQTALDEDVNVIGISSLCGGHMYVISEIIGLLKEKGMEGITVLLGGVIPDDDIPELEKMRVKVFGPGSFTRDIVDHIEATQKVR